MGSFKEEDWTRFDFWSLVVGQGLITIEIYEQDRCRDWLINHGYTITVLDFASGISPAVSRLAQILSWEQQFSYNLEPESRNLDALRDGFSRFPVPDIGGSVLELKGYESAWSEDLKWSKGLLEIIQEYSLVQLALGRRFFATILVSNQQSSLIGQALEAPTISFPFSSWRS